MVEWIMAQDLVLPKSHFELLQERKQRNLALTKEWLAFRSDWNYSQLAQFLGVSRAAARDYVRQLQGKDTRVDRARERRARRRGEVSIQEKLL